MSLPIKKRKSKRQLLPNIIALPIPRLNVVSDRVRRMPLDGTDVPPGVFEAADALAVVIALVHSFIDGDVVFSNISDWLYNLDGAIGELEASIIDGWFDKNPTNATEGVNLLLESANNVPDLESDIDDFECIGAVRALIFWIEEIVRRIHELCDICIRSIDSIAAEIVFKDVRTLDYPFY